MRKFPPWGILCAACLTFPSGGLFGQETSSKPAVVQAGHFFHKDETGQCQEVKVVVELSQPEVVVRPGNTAPASEPRERCCLFHRFHRAERATVGSFIFTPAALPLNQGAAVPQPTQGANVDLSGLRNLHDMQERLATIDAQQAAQEAIRQQTQGALNRLTQSLQAYGSRAGQSGTSGAGAGAGGGGGGTVSDQLKTLDNRLSKLEDLVLKHQDTLRFLVEKAKEPEKIPAPKPNEKPPEEKPMPAPVNSVDTPKEGKDGGKKDEKPDAKGDPSAKMSANTPEVLHLPTPAK